MAASKGILVSILVLRILSLLLLGGSIVVLGTNNFTLSDGSKTSFKDVDTYRYVIATAILAFLYMLLQIPFAVYHVCTGKRMIRNGCLPQFDFYGDKVFAFLVATGVGAGFAVTFELKKVARQFFEGVNIPGIDEEISKMNQFLNRVYISTGILFLGFLCMAVVSVLSSISRSTTGRSLFG